MSERCKCNAKVAHFHNPGDSHLPAEDEIIVKIPNHMENNPLCRGLSDTIIRIPKPSSHGTVLKKLKNK